MNEQDSLQGSYPMVNNSVASGSIVFLDNNTMNFVSATIYYGTNLRVGGTYVSGLSYLTTSLTGSGRVVAGVSDSFVEFSASLPSRPFVDSAQDAVDGKSRDDAFYATGSNIEGFKDPLWSKNRIEIDFSPRVASTLSGSRGNWMGYYNWSTRKWDGRQADPGGNVGAPGFSYEAVGIGFTPSYHPIFGAKDHPKQNGAKGKPFSNFGFPFDPTFHATSSQLLSISDYISRPFVVEKIIVMMSASYNKASGTDIWTNAVNYDSDPLYGAGAAYQMCSSSYLVNNFFILNQRNGTAKNETVSILDMDGEQRLYLRNGTNVSGTIRDLVTWFEIASFNNDYGNVYTASLNRNMFYRDFTIVNSGSTDAMYSSWSQNIVMSSSIRSPNFTPAAGLNNIGSLADIDISLRRYPMAWLGSRSGLDGVNTSGRDLRNPMGAYTGETLSGMMIGGNANSWGRENPYVLMPGDQLVIGWQVPSIDYNTPWNPSLGLVTGSVAHFPVSPAKIIMYGSYISDGEGVNETSNQVLSSNSIHEAIE